MTAVFEKQGLVFIIAFTTTSRPILGYNKQLRPSATDVSYFFLTASSAPNLADKWLYSQAYFKLRTGTNFGVKSHLTTHHLQANGITRTHICRHCY